MLLGGAKSDKLALDSSSDIIQKFEFLAHAQRFNFSSRDFSVVIFFFHFGVMSQSSASFSFSSGGSLTGFSTKPWFITYDQSTEDVLVWKSGMRLKVQERAGESSESTGCLREVSVIEKKNGGLLVSYLRSQLG